MNRRRALLLATALLLVLGAAWWRSPSARSVPPSSAPSDRTAPATITPVEAGAASPAPSPPATATPPPERDPAADAGPEATDPDAARRTMLAWLAHNAETAEKNVDRLCEDTKQLAALDPLGDRPRTRDAASYLGVRVDWEGGRRGLLHLPDAVVTRLRASSTPGAWLTVLEERDWAGLDFGWMHELLAYDHWSLGVDGPNRDPLSLTLLEMPMPNFIGLQDWTKLRLASSLRSGTLPQASVEVRHLADLIGSTSTLLGEMIRVVLLRFERQAWEASGQPIPSTSSMTAEARDLARRVQFGAAFFLYPGVPRAVREKALRCAPARCTALMEALAAHVAFRDLVPAAQEGIDWVLDQRPCDPALAAKGARGPATSAEQLVRSYVGSVGNTYEPPGDAGQGT